MIWLSVIGIIFLAFRLWIVEYRTKPQLKDETTYFSRIICYYLAIAMIFDFNLISINAILTTSLPSFSIICGLFDFRFFYKIKEIHPGLSKNEYFWLIMERATLHFPIIASGIYMFVDGWENYVNLSRGFLPLIIAGCMFYIPFLFRDTRWKQKKEWPLGLYIFFFSIGQVTWMILAFREAIFFNL